MAMVVSSMLAVLAVIAMPVLAFAFALALAPFFE